MQPDFDYPFDVTESVFATLLGRGILFVAAIAVGLNIGSLTREGRLVEPGGIVFAIAITSVGWMFSLHLLAVCLISLSTGVVLVVSESRSAVVAWLLALGAAWCSVLWLF